MFVTKLLGDMITSGRVEADARGIADGVITLRKVWQHTFGQDEQ